LLMSAANHLVAVLQDPRVSIAVKAQSWYIPICLRIVTDLNVPEILEEAGDRGLHSDDIGNKANVDAGKIARILRLLATDHFFREIEPNVFANNKRSSLLSTNKPSAEVIANPESKHDGSSGIPALVSMLAARNMRVGCEMFDNLTDPITKYSQEPAHSTFTRVLGKPLFDWMNDPDNAFERKKFGIAMSGTVGFQPPGLMLKAFNWKDLPNDAVVVDVGGGVGSASLELAKAHSHLTFIVQDIPPVAADGARWFEARLPSAIEQGRVKFEGHDFFTPQPDRGKHPDVFFLRLITHDWSVKYLSKLLQNLRNAAGKDTRLLIQDSILLNACPIPNDNLPEVRGVPVLQPPAPLLANLGIISPYQSDMGMMNALNSQERTLLEFQTILASCGWKIQYVYRYDRVGTALIVALPM